MRKIAISDTGFSGMIKRKYEAGKIPLRLPIMIFLKNIGNFISRRININLIIGFDINFKDSAHIWIMKYLVRIKHWMPAVKLPGDLHKIMVYELGMKIFQAGKDTGQTYKGSPVLSFQINYPAIIREDLKTHYYRTISAYDHPSPQTVIQHRFSRHINYQKDFDYEKISQYNNYYFMQKWVGLLHPPIYNFSFSAYRDGTGSYERPKSAGKIVFPSIMGNMLSLRDNEKYHMFPGISHYSNYAISVPAKIGVSTGGTTKEKMGIGQRKNAQIKNYRQTTKYSDITGTGTLLVYNNLNWIFNKQQILNNTAKNRLIINPLTGTFFNTYKNSFHYTMKDHNVENKPVPENYTNKSGFEAMNYTNLSSINADISPFNSYDRGGKVFSFDSREKIEREINEIKKMIIETKESIKRKQEPSHGQRGIDIDVNGISEQVYKDIEKNIMIERERRGL